MLSNSDQTPLLQAWHSDLHYAIEAGIAPLVPLGLSASALTALPALSLLRDLAVERTDMTIPTVLMGGSSGAWLAALFVIADGAPGRSSLASHPNAGRSPQPVLLFSGVDAATHMASAGVLPKPPRGLRAITDRELPMGVRDPVAPILQPAAPITWENLPLRILETPDSSRASTAGLPPASLWMGILAALLVLIMILGALIV